MCSLARLVRGLSALFWGLPLALVVCVQTARTDFFAPFGVAPPLLVTVILWYAVRQLGHFRQHERVWRKALDRAQVAALINVGLSPFLYWWKVMPEVVHYKFAALAMALSGLVFLLFLNQALQRLAAMLPEETLRIEAKLFTNLNLWLLSAVFMLGALWTGLHQFQQPPPALAQMLVDVSHFGLLTLLLLVLLPLALTMTLAWRIKELILTSVFSAKT